MPCCDGLPKRRIGACAVEMSVVFLNNQPDALFIQIYCHKTPHVSGIFSAHHQESPTVHSALVSFLQVMMTASKESQDGTALQLNPDSVWKRSSKTCMKLTTVKPA